MEHPGLELERKLINAGMTRKELALRTGVSEKHISTIINGERDISMSFARKLGYVFENAKFWVNLQSNYDEDQQRIKDEKNISQEEINILKSLNEITTYFNKRGYIHINSKETSKVIELRSFLNISNLALIPKITYNAAYRVQLSTNVKVDSYVLFAWQRLCEKETENISVSSNLNIEKLRDSLDNIKQIMFGDIKNGIQDLQRLFAECGIAFQVVRNFKGAPVQGFIKETTDKHLILCMTIRRKRADTFWFTLYHKIAHILYGDYSNRFVDFDSIDNEKEIRADNFARDQLIPPTLYREFIFSGKYNSWAGIEEFAKSAGVKPYIVLGRLQKDEILDWSSYPEKIVKYKWAK